MGRDPSTKRRAALQTPPKPRPPKPESTKPAGPVSGDLFQASEAPARIFSRIADWAEEFHPASPEPLKLSSSAVENYRKCPQRYMFGHLWSLKEGPRAMLSFGSVIHTTIKRFLEQFKKGVKLPFDEVQRIYETEWTSAGYEDEYQEAEYKKDGVEELKAFHEAMLEDPPDILEQEKGFELPLENNVILTGRMDQVNSLGRRDVEIVDYKTGKPKKDADARKALPLGI